jgi:hypothetical protein
VDLIGEWDVAIKTPIGSLQVLYTFKTDSGVLTGTAAGKGETVALRDIIVAAQRVTWRQSVTKPMRLNLQFDVMVDGDRLTGHSKAGRLPRSAVTGVRRNCALRGQLVPVVLTLLLSLADGELLDLAGSGERVAINGVPPRRYLLR